MKAKYRNLIRNLRNKLSGEIEEADANPGKWYELFIDEGEQVGTHTVHSAPTFDQVVTCFEKFAGQYGKENTHIDIMTNSGDPETAKSCI